jgi:hypothetical protein
MQKEQVGSTDNKDKVTHELVSKITTIFMDLRRRFFEEQNPSASSDMLRIRDYVFTQQSQNINSKIRQIVPRNSFISYIVDAAFDLVKKQSSYLSLSLAEQISYLFDGKYNLLQLAICCGDCDLVKTLIDKYGFNVNFIAKNNDSKSTETAKTIYECYQDQDNIKLSIINEQVLSNYYARISAVNNDSWKDSSMDIAIKTLQPEMLEILIKKGVILHTNEYSFFSIVTSLDFINYQNHPYEIILEKFYQLCRAYISNLTATEFSKYRERIMLDLEILITHISLHKVLPKLYINPNSMITIRNNFTLKMLALLCEFKRQAPEIIENITEAPFKMTVFPDYYNNIINNTLSLREWMALHKDTRKILLDNLPVFIFIKLFKQITEKFLLKNDSEFKNGTFLSQLRDRLSEFLDITCQDYSNSHATLVEVHDYNFKSLISALLVQPLPFPYEEIHNLIVKKPEVKKALTKHCMIICIALAEQLRRSNKDDNSFNYILNIVQINASLFSGQDYKFLQSAYSDIMQEFFRNPRQGKLNSNPIDDAKEKELHLIAFLFIFLLHPKPITDGVDEASIVTITNHAKQTVQFDLKQFFSNDSVNLSYFMTKLVTIQKMETQINATLSFSEQIKKIPVLTCYYTTLDKLGEMANESILKAHRNKYFGIVKLMLATGADPYQLYTIAKQQISFIYTLIRSLADNQDSDSYTILIDILKTKCNLEQIVYVNDNEVSYLSHFLDTLYKVVGTSLIDYMQITQGFDKLSQLKLAAVGFKYNQFKFANSIIRNLKLTFDEITLPVFGDQSLFICIVANIHAEPPVKIVNLIPDPCVRINGLSPLFYALYYQNLSMLDIFIPKIQVVNLQEEFTFQNEVITLEQLAKKWDAKNPLSNKVLDRLSKLAVKAKSQSSIVAPINATTKTKRTGNVNESTKPAMKTQQVLASLQNNKQKKQEEQNKGKQVKRASKQEASIVKPAPKQTIEKVVNTSTYVEIPQSQLISYTDYLQDQKLKLDPAVTQAHEHLMLLFDTKKYIEKNECDHTLNEENDRSIIINKLYYHFVRFFVALTQFPPGQRFFNHEVIVNIRNFFSHHFEADYSVICVNKLLLAVNDLSNCESILRDKIQGIMTTVYFNFDATLTHCISDKVPIASSEYYVAVIKKQLEIVIRIGKVLTEPNLFDSYPQRITACKGSMLLIGSALADLRKLSPEIYLQLCIDKQLKAIFRDIIENRNIAAHSVTNTDYNDLLQARSEAEKSGSADNFPIVSFNDISDTTIYNLLNKMKALNEQALTVLDQYLQVKQPILGIPVNTLFFSPQNENDQGSQAIAPVIVTENLNQPLIFDPIKKHSNF